MAFPARSLGLSMHGGYAVLQSREHPSTPLLLCWHSQSFTDPRACGIRR